MGHRASQPPENETGSVASKMAPKRNQLEKESLCSSGSPCRASTKDFQMSHGLVTAFVAGFLVFMSAACNTVEGAGKDVSSAGDAVSNAADDAK